MDALTGIGDFTVVDYVVSPAYVKQTYPLWVSLSAIGDH
jgi:hypothetical protein